jgi:hypothetical protein
LAGRNAPVTFLGAPMLAYVDWAFLGHRIYRLGQNRSYIYLPFLITMIVAMRRRELFALARSRGFLGYCWPSLHDRQLPAS